MKKILLISFMLISALIIDATAQEQTVSGKITDTDGLALPGVNVILKGTATGTTSDIDGNYKVSVPANGGFLVFSFIGFATQEIEIGTQSTINVTLLGDTKQLSEVVVTGYGTTLKKEFSGASVSIKSEDIGKIPATSTNQILQGQASGVLVTSSSGAPGGGVSVQIRGLKTINGSAQPLYVIDGVPVVAGNLQQQGFGGQQQNALSGLNPQDIESIEVLKDASSTAIYGSRGANGVVLVTTKRGKTGKSSINLSAWTGWGEPTEVLQTISAQEFVDIRNEARVNSGLAARTNAEYGWDGVTDTRWVDETFRTSRISEYQLNMTGGNEKTKFYLSGSFRDEEGAMLGSSFKRGTGRVNLDHRATDKLSFGLSFSASSDLADRIQNDNNIFGVYSTSILGNPLTPIRDPETGEFVNGQVFNTNPVRSALAPRYDNKTLKVIGNLFAQYEITDGLTFRADFGYDYTSLTEDHYDPASTSRGSGTNGLGRFNFRSVGTFNIEPTLRYTKVVNDVHSFNAIVGGTLLSRNDFRNSVTGNEFAKESLTYITSAAVVNAGSSFRTDYSFNSLFGRLNYAYDEKYLASVSVRRDGSSRFGSGNRFGVFWAVSAGWNFSEESFLANASWLELGKIRASYGITGSDNIGNFGFFGAFSGGGNYLDRPAFLPSQIENSELKWEETSSLDIGLELSLFQSRINLNLGYFKQNTTDLLFFAPLPATTGFTGVNDNIGEIENSGIEIELGTVNVSTVSGFKWSTDFNITFLENEVVSLVNDEPILRGFSSAIIPGQPLNTFYGLRWLGVDPATGDSQFEDIDGDGTVTSADVGIFGDASPDFIGGFTNKFSYKGLSLDVFFQFVQGSDIYNNTRAFAENPASNFGKSRAVLNRWQNPGDITDVPRVTQNFGFNGADNSRWLEDGSYIRLKNITLAYNFSPELLSKIKLANARIYVTGQNLLTITDYSLDPEVSVFGATNTSQGTDFLTQPQSKLFLVGINVGF